MNEINKSELKTSNRIKSSDIIYIIILLLFFILVVIIFSYSTNFIIKNINKVFFIDQNSNIQALDKSRYSILEKKLGLINQNQILDNVTVIQNTTETQKVVEPIKIPELDKKILTINIVNAAKKAGVASSLSKSLEDAGYNKATTSDAKKVSTKTTVAIKNSKKDYDQLIIDVIKNTYPNVITKINPENSKFDIVITVGK